MARLAKTALLSIAILLSSATSYAQIVGATIGYTLDELEAKFSTLAVQAENSANNVVNNAAVNALNIIKQFKEDYKDILQETSDELTIQQRQIFEGLETRLNTLYTEIENEHARIDDTVDNLASYASDTIFVSGAPRLSRFKTSYIVNSDKFSDDVKLTYRGKRLNDDRNFVVVGNQELKQPSTRSDTSLAFNFNKADFLSELGDKGYGFIGSKLTLFQKRRFWFDKKSTHIFQTFVYPEEIAEITIVTKTEKTTEVERKAIRREGNGGSIRSGRTSRRSTGYSGNYYPEDGWKIDTATVSVGQNLSNDCSGRSRVGISNSSTSIVSVSGSYVTERGTGGRSTCHYSTVVSFEQYREETETIDVKSDAYSLQYGEPIKYDIPDNNIFSHIDVTLFNGKKEVLGEETVSKLFKLSVDPASQTVIISSEL